MFFLSMLVGTFVYGEDAGPNCCIEQGCLCEQVDGGYNYPARIDTCPWNVYAEVSFNYWQPCQENMELGIFNNAESSSVEISGITITSVKTSDSLRYIDMDFSFKPGFTVGLNVNFDHDDWDMHVEYTWFHNSNTKSITASNFVFFHSDSQHISPTWGKLLRSS